MSKPYWLALLPLLAACTPAATEHRPATAPAAPTQPGEDATAPAPEPAAATARGTATVLGKPADALLTLFGPASLDRTERDTRHLQFGGSPCILDIYLLPEAENAPATARHVEARLIDGKDANPAECINRRLRDLAEEEHPSVS